MHGPHGEFLRLGLAPVNAGPTRRAPRFLVIATQYPVPALNGGTMRTMHAVRVLARRGVVDLAYVFVPDGSDLQDATFRTTLQLEVTDRGRVAQQVLAGLVTRRPFPVHAFGRASRAALAALIEANDYDAILVRSGHALGLLDVLGDAARRRVVIDLDDNIGASLYTQLVGETGSALRRVILAANRKALVWYERRAVRGHVCTVCTADDLERLAPHARKVFIVPNVYDPGPSFAAPTVSGFSQPDSFLFVGALGYPPNADGLAWFVREVFPKVRARISGATLVVVGRQPPDAVRTLCSDAEGVELHADVPDVAGYYERCRAVVVPLLSGGGTRIKILEACFAGRPVLSTPLGAQGLDLRDGEDLLLFRSSTEFLEAYSRLAEAGPYDAMVRKARASVTLSYSPERVDRVMAEVLDTIGSSR